jgi:hypothetical protein
MGGRGGGRGVDGGGGGGGNSVRIIATDTRHTKRLANTLSRSVNRLRDQLDFLP